MVVHLAEALLETHVDAAEMALEGRKPPAVHSGRARVASSGGALKVSEAGERYLAGRTRDAKSALSEQTVAQARTTLRLFAESAGDARLDAP